MHGGMTASGQDTREGAPGGGEGDIGLRPPRLHSLPALPQGFTDLLRLPQEWKLQLGKAGLGGIWGNPVVPPPNLRALHPLPGVRG